MTSLSVRRRLAPLGIGAAAFLLPHGALLAISRVPPFFQRELTLWPTLILLLVGSVLVGMGSAPWWRAVLLLLAGLTVAIVGYIAATADRGGVQILGAVSRPFLWGMAVGLGVLLATPPILMGTLLGALIRRRRALEC